MSNKKSKKEKQDSLFSERYGYKKINESMLFEQIPEYLRKRLWNILFAIIFYPIQARKQFSYEDEVMAFIMKLWDEFLKKDIEELSDLIKYGENNQYRDHIKNWFFVSEWFEIYDFIQFICKSYPIEEVKDKLINIINETLKDERAPYRIIDYIVTPITNKEEIEEIEKALKPPDKFSSIREHLGKALERLSDRKNPDYQNSIKESMSALDSLVSAIKDKKTIFPKFANELDIHKALKDGFVKLYSWSSDAEGIRHGITGEKLKPLQTEARYMLVTISAFINYVIDKYSQSN